MHKLLIVKIIKKKADKLPELIRFLQKRSVAINMGKHNKEIFEYGQIALLRKRLIVAGIWINWIFTCLKNNLEYNRFLNEKLQIDSHLKDNLIIPLTIYSYTLK